MSDVLVLGSANMDLVVRQPRLPRPGETLTGSSFTTVPGGKGLNQAVAAARAGADVGFLGAVGADSFGERLRLALQDEGVDLTGLVTVDGPSGIAAISVVDGGENSIVVVAGANDAVPQLDEASRSLIAASRFLVAQLERPLELVRSAFAAARTAGVTTVLTPAPVTELPSGLLEQVDVLVPNAAEACELAGRDDPTTAALTLSDAAGMVVMTRGADGALVAVGGRVVADVPARRVTAIDTTAAGDTFVGFLVAALAAGETLDTALRHATAAASISVTRPGATTSMPSRAEVDALLSPG